MRRRRPAGDEGTVMVLVLGFTVVLLGLLVLVVDVSVLLLAQRGVASTADGAAAAAAQELDETALYTRGLDECVPLSRTGVAQAVLAHAAAAGDGTQLEPGLADAFTVEVQASRRVALPFGSYVGAGEVVVRSTARARSPLAGSDAC